VALSSTGDADADAVLAQMAQPASVSSGTGDPDADAVIRHLGETNPTWGQAFKGAGGMFLGGAEGLAHAATGSVGALGGGLNYLGTLAATRDPEAAKAVQEATQSALTYQPRTAEGKASAGAIDTAASYLGPKEGEAAGPWVTDKATALGAPPQLAAGLGAAANTGIQAIPYAVGARSLRGPDSAIDPDAATVRIEPSGGSMMNDPQSISAARAAPALDTASPELKAAVEAAAQKTGGAVNPQVLERHVEADSLPVKMQLTEGQATQNPALISQEQNMRGKQPDLANRFNQQNGQLVQNLQAIRDQVGPEVFSTNPVEHGETLINAYKDKDAAAQADISQKYQELRDANGGQFPVDAQKLLDNASANLHSQLLYDHAPKPIMSTLGRLADDGNMTFENFESLRTNLARIQRSPVADGNEKAAAGIIRNSMENLPLADGAAQLKPLADTARAAAKAQFSALDVDPAYKAAVNDTVPPDRFVQKYIVSAPKEDVATMKSNMADNDQATQTMGVAALDHLRSKAGIDSQGNGNFSQAGYNRYLEAISPKAGILFDPQTSGQLQTLGNVARYTQFQPRGSYVNNSNTFTASMADYGKSALEGAANVAAKGVPVGTWTRQALQNRATAKSVQKSLEPGAGLSSLSDILKAGSNP
jgi:hypothetical protein